MFRLPGQRVPVVSWTGIRGAIDLGISPHFRPRRHLRRNDFRFTIWDHVTGNIALTTAT
jgi:hypothetical protein